jgi:hypothetical protein
MHSFFGSLKICDRINQSDAEECWRRYFHLLNCILFFFNFSLLTFLFTENRSIWVKAILRSLFSNNLWLVCVTGIGTTVSNEHLSPPSNSLPSCCLLAQNQQPIFPSDILLSVFTPSVTSLSLNKPFRQAVICDLLSRCPRGLINVRRDISWQFRWVKTEH